MPENIVDQKTPKHLHGFWPLFLLFVVALVLGGIITIFAYNSGLDEEINSLYIGGKKPAAKQVPAK